MPTLNLILLYFETLFLHITDHQVLTQGSMKQPTVCIRIIEDEDTGVYLSPVPDDLVQKYALDLTKLTWRLKKFKV